MNGKLSVLPSIMSATDMMWTTPFVEKVPLTCGCQWIEYYSVQFKGQISCHVYEEYIIEFLIVEEL